jgi:hypothetical protein
MGHAAIRGNAKVAGSDGLLYETPLPVRGIKRNAIN